MSRYLISGYYGFGNAGDEAILRAIVRNLRECDPEAQLTVLSARPELTAREHSVEAVRRTDLLRIAACMRRADLFISGGGGLLQDVTSSRSLLYYLSLIRLAQLQRCPTMIFANSMGPVRRPLNQVLARSVLNRTECITVRDQYSLQVLQDWGVTQPQVELTADPVLLLPGSTVAPEPQRIALAIRNWKSGHDYQAEIIAAGRQLVQSGFQLQFIPLHYSHDLSLAQRLAQQVGAGASCLEQPQTFTQLLNALAAAEVVIAMRLHALIMAAICLRPCVGISYDPKVTGFLESFAQPIAGSTDDLQASQLVTQVQEVYAKRQQISREIAVTLEAQRRLAARNGQIACSLAKGVGR